MVQFKGQASSWRVPTMSQSLPPQTCPCLELYQCQAFSGAGQDAAQQQQVHGGPQAVPKEVLRVYGAAATYRGTLMATLSLCHMGTKVRPGN